MFISNYMYTCIRLAETFQLPLANVYELILLRYIPQQYTQARTHSCTHAYLHIA